MPATTLCVAMRRERRAMTWASPRRSSRSTVSTTSAASEDTVAPRAPMATPTAARASAGASLMPSPTMIVAPPALSRRTTATLSAGLCSATTSSTPIMAPTAAATSARSPVTITTRRMPARRRLRIVRAASGRIGSLRTSAPAGTPSTPTKTQTAPSSSLRCRAVITHGSSPRTPTQPALPSGDVVLADACRGCPNRRPRSSDSAGRGRARGRDRRARSRSPGRAGETWSSEAARRSTSAGVAPVGGDDLDQRRSADRERAGLVEQQDLGVGQPLERPAALHDHTATSGPRQTGDDGDRGGEDQRARRGDHQARRPPDSARRRSPTPRRRRPR